MSLHAVVDGCVSAQTVERVPIDDCLHRPTQDLDATVPLRAGQPGSTKMLAKFDPSCSVCVNSLSGHAHVLAQASDASHSKKDMLDKFPGLRIRSAHVSRSAGKAKYAIKLFA